MRLDILSYLLESHRPKYRNQRIYRQSRCQNEIPEAGRELRHPRRDRYTPSFRSGRIWGAPSSVPRHFHWNTTETSSHQKRSVQSEKKKREEYFACASQVKFLHHNLYVILVTPLILVIRVFTSSCMYMMIMRGGGGYSPIWLRLFDWVLLLLLLLLPCLSERSVRTVQVISNASGYLVRI